MRTLISVLDIVSSHFKDLTPAILFNNYFREITDINEKKSLIYTYIFACARELIFEDI